MPPTIFTYDLARVKVTLQNLTGKFLKLVINQIKLRTFTVPSN